MTSELRFEEITRQEVTSVSIRSRSCDCGCGGTVEVRGYDPDTDDRWVTVHWGDAAKPEGKRYTYLDFKDMAHLRAWASADLLAAAEELCGWVAMLEAQYEGVPAKSLQIAASIDRARAAIAKARP